MPCLTDPTCDDLLVDGEDVDDASAHNGHKKIDRAKAALADYIARGDTDGVRT